MLNIYKNKGATLLELMVSLSLGLLLMFSMLAFYSVTQQNLVAHTTASKEQQQLRKMAHLMTRNIENTGAFECAQESEIFRNIGNISVGDRYSTIRADRVDIKRFPKEIISLGEFDQKDRQQFIFVHPVSEEYLDRSLGLMDIQVKDSITTAHYSPVEIKANCGAEESTIYIGSTIIETVPLSQDTKRPPITQAKETSAEAKTVTADGVKAFVVMSGLQPRLRTIGETDPSNSLLAEFRDRMTVGYDRAYFLKRIRNYGGVDRMYSSGPGSDYHAEISSKLTTQPSKDQYTFSYLPSIYDGTTAYLSNEKDIEDLPFGKNEVEISLGFAIDKFSSAVPNHTMSALNSGGWITPYKSKSGYDLIVDTNGTTDEDARLINKVLHHKDVDPVGHEMKTYPLRPEAAEQVRAVKFKFTLDKGTDQEKVITRVVRFKSIHLKKLTDE